MNHPELGVKSLDLPCLMLTAEWDPDLRPKFAADMPKRCSQLEMHLIDKAGHWIKQEHANLFKRYLIDWLDRTYRSQT